MLTAPLLVVCLWLLPSGTNGFALSTAFQQLLTNQIVLDASVKRWKEDLENKTKQRQEDNIFRKHKKIKLERTNSQRICFEVQTRQKRSNLSERRTPSEIKASGTIHYFNTIHSFLSNTLKTEEVQRNTTLRNFLNDIRTKFLKIPSQANETVQLNMTMGVLSALLQLRPLLNATRNNEPIYSEFYDNATNALSWVCHSVATYEYPMKDNMTAIANKISVYRKDQTTLRQMFTIVETILTGLKCYFKVLPWMLSVAFPNPSAGSEKIKKDAAGGTDLIGMICTSSWKISTRLKEDFENLAAKFGNTTDPDFIEMANLSIWSVTMASRLNVNKSHELVFAFDSIRIMNRNSSVNSQLSSLEKGLSFITKIFRLYPESYLGTSIMNYLGFVMYCILKAVLQLGGFSIGVDWTNVIANLEKTLDQSELSDGDISSKILEVGEAMMLGLTYYRDSLDILSLRSESFA